MSETGPAKRRKRKGEGPQRRAEILEAAKTLFVNEGYAATTIRRVAKKVGISSTALYVYFPDKDAILREICNETFAFLIQSLDTVVVEYPDPMDALSAALTGYIRFGISHPNEYELTFVSRASKRVHDDEEEEEVDLGKQAYLRFLGRIEAVVQAGLTVETDSSRLTNQLWTAVHGLVSMLLLKGASDWGDREALIDGHVAMLVRGIRK